MLLKCSTTGKNFLVSQGEQDFLAKFKAAYPWNKSINIPDCASETLRNVFVYGNTINLYRAKSAISQRSQLSRFDPKTGIKIVTPEEFWSDAVDNTKFGINFNPQEDFFQQWHKLLLSCQLLPLGNVNVENSDYVNGTLNVKNCYLCFSCVNGQDNLYGFMLYNSSDCIDCSFCNMCNYCYECVDCENSYECQHCTLCQTSRNCFACYDCNNCKDCIACYGLEHQQYQIFNQQFTEIEYKRMLLQFKLDTYSGRTLLLNKFSKILSERKPQVNTIINCQDSTGAYLENSKNLTHCYNISKSQDCGYLVGGQNNIDCWKGFFHGSEFCYTGNAISSSECHFCYHAFESSNCWYSFGVYQNCNNCFGCVGLKKKSYCILNKQYSKSEYFEVISQISQQMQKNNSWMKYFPRNLAPHYYNESVIDEFLEEVSDEQAKASGYIFSPSANTETPAQIDSASLPDAIAEATEDLCSKSISCSKTGKAFNIQRKELEFLKSYSIPLPREHWRERIRNATRKRLRIPSELLT